ncbi:MAG: hypothetical protein J5852_09835 [Clostridia bacterium]|nr:hypothetical protein [Clostridia bacterium]
MNKLLSKLPAVINKPKILMTAGLIGIALIFLSTLIPSGAKEKTAEESSIGAEEYRKITEENVKKIVTGITGDEDSTVVVTLESGIRYNYADSKESDTSASTDKESEQNRKATKQSYITVKGSDGDEKPLIVTEIMPEIRGVAIVCESGDIPAVAEMIQNAVTAALDITSQRVYVSGGISNEKG